MGLAVAPGRNQGTLALMIALAKTAVAAKKATTISCSNKHGEKLVTSLRQFSRCPPGNSDTAALRISKA